MRFLLQLLLVTLTKFALCQGWTPAEVCEDSPYFLFTNKYGKFGIEDSTCKVIVPAEYNFLYLNRTPTDYCGRVDRKGNVIPKK